IPGMLRDIMRHAPHGARIVVAGGCMDDDTIRPLGGINKELSPPFVLGYTPPQFPDTPAAPPPRPPRVAALRAGAVGAEGVAQAFRDLATPEQHAKILVEPWRS